MAMESNAHKAQRGATLVEYIMIVTLLGMALLFVSDLLIERSQSYQEKANQSLQDTNYTTFTGK